MVCLCMLTERSILYINTGVLPLVLNGLKVINEYPKIRPAYIVTEVKLVLRNK